MSKTKLTISALLNSGALNTEQRERLRYALESLTISGHLTFTNINASDIMEDLINLGKEIAEK